MTRLRFGKCFVNEYLAMINCSDTDKCPYCKFSVETVEHLLLRCPQSILCEKVLSVCRQLNVTAVIPNVLSNSKIMDTVFVLIKRQI